VYQQKNIQTKLAKGLLDLIVLRLLEKRPMHGYELIVTIRNLFGVYFGASTIYPLLTSMEKKKCVESEWTTDSERPRKVYKLTSNGKAILECTSETLNLIFSSIRTIGSQPKTAVRQDQACEELSKPLKLRV
jgi:PadR family transcriptional regulator PadR